MPEEPEPGTQEPGEGTETEQDTLTGVLTIIDLAMRPKQDIDISLP